MGIGSILQTLLDEKNTNVNEVAKSTGVSPSTLYSIIKRDSTKASIDDLYKVAHYLGVTLDYFYSRYQHELCATNQEPDDEITEAQTPDEKRLLNYYRKLNMQGKEYILQTMDLVAEKYSDSKSDGLPSMEAGEETA